MQKSSLSATFLIKPELENFVIEVSVAFEVVSSVSKSGLGEACDCIRFCIAFSSFSPRGRVISSISKPGLGHLFCNYRFLDFESATTI